jgi:hypothetical protein
MELFFFGWFVGLVAKDFCSALSVLVGPAQNNFPYRKLLQAG